MSTARQQRPVSLPSDQDESGRTLGSEEIELVTEAIRSGTLTSTRGRFVKLLEREFAAMSESRHALACSSGTAAIHAAVAAVDPEPGEEIITSPITDMGALTPILYQGAVPVFADVDPVTGNITRKAIEDRLSERTRAVIVTHLFGQPCDIEDITRVASARGVKVIEDCAQAMGARHRGRPVGRFGDIACYSLQQGKHMTAGEGGLVATEDDALARRMYLFINKAWGYGDPSPDHYFLALNSRMSELQGAVALAQLRKLPQSVANRVNAARHLTARLRGAPGILTPEVEPHDVHAFWRYAVRVDGNVILGGSVAMGRLLADSGIASAPRYIQKPAFQCAIFREQRTFGASRFPFTLARPETVDYSPSHYPGVFQALDSLLVLPWNERYDESHVEYLAGAILHAAARLAGGPQ